jgi:aminoglycoside phosphotransferase (APT) family kinase protein
MNKQSHLYQELDLSVIQELARTHLGLSPNGLTAQLLVGGLFNTTYKLTHPSHLSGWILRLGPINRHLLLPYEHHLMEGEAYVSRILANAGFPCAPIRACDTSKRLVDRDYMVMDYIPSVPLSDASVSEEDKERLFADVGRWAARMHNEIVAPVYGRAADVARGEGHGDWASFLLAEARKSGEQCGAFAVFTSREIERITAVFAAHPALYCDTTVPRLVHADLWAGNVLVRRAAEGGEYEIAAIIDADRALFGDPAFEFAPLWMNNAALDRGYGRVAEPPDEAHRFRMRTYQLLSALMDTYIWKVQYNSPEEYDRNKQHTLSLLEAIEAEDGRFAG